LAPVRCGGALPSERTPFHATSSSTGHHRHRHRRKCPRKPKLIEHLLCEPEDNGLLWIKSSQPERINNLVGTAEENGTVVQVGQYSTPAMTIPIFASS
jgi:hypothetical protein